MSTNTKILKLLFILLIASTTNAQDVWSLEKCILHAMENSLTVEQAKQGVSFAEINLNQAKQERYPNLNGNINGNWNFGRTIDPATNEFNTQTNFFNNFGLNTGATLWNGFRIKNSITQNQVNLKAAKEDSEQVRRDIALQVASNYLNVLFAQENVTLAERQLDISEQELNQLSKLIAAGARPQSEKLNLEAQIALSQQGLIAAQNAVDIAYLNLKQNLRLDPNTDLKIEVPKEIPIDTDPDLIEFDQAFKSAVQNRPDLKASDYRIKSAEIGINIAEAFKYPSLNIGGNVGSVYSSQFKNLVGVGYGDQLDQNLSYGLGFGLSIPVYNRGQTKAGIERAKLNVIDNRLAKEQIVDGLKAVVQQSIADARAAKLKKQASLKSLDAQKLAFENASKRLEIGAANSFEWESQKTLLENAEITHLIDKYDYLFKIKVLEFYLGKPLKF